MAGDSYRQKCAGTPCEKLLCGDSVVLLRMKKTLQLSPAAFAPTKGISKPDALKFSHGAFAP